MNVLLVAVLVPLHFTAPADPIGLDSMGRVRWSAAPVHAYVFHRLDSNGTMTAIPGYADSTGSAILTPHLPGTQETVWLAPGPNTPATIYVMSLDASGNLSHPSNGHVIGRRLLAAQAVPARPAWTTLNVPLVKQTRRRGGHAALEMVLRYYGAAPAALREVESDPDPRGPLIADLASAARRAGYEAAITTLTTDSLIVLLNEGVPPILLYRNGFGPGTVQNFGVVTGWDATRASFTLQDGGARRRETRRDDLVKRWETAGSQALIVRQRVP